MKQQWHRGFAENISYLTVPCLNLIAYIKRLLISSILIIFAVALWPTNSFAYEHYDEIKRETVILPDGQTGEMILLRGIAAEDYTKIIVIDHEQKVIASSPETTSIISYCNIINKDCYGYDHTTKQIYIIDLDVKEIDPRKEEWGFRTEQASFMTIVSLEIKFIIEFYELSIIFIIQGLLLSLISMIKFKKIDPNNKISFIILLFKMFLKLLFILFFIMLIWGYKDLNNIPVSTCIICIILGCIIGYGIRLLHHNLIYKQKNNA